jgi:hypothetical protein
MMSYRRAKGDSPPCRERKWKEKKKVQYRKVRAWVKMVDSNHTGVICLPKDQGRISVLMNDKRQFTSMTDMESKKFASPKAYLATNKDLIELLEVLDFDRERES